MKRAWVVTTFLSISSAANAQVTPGSGSITDASGNVWLITPSGSIQENGQWTPGGGGTSGLLVADSVVYGEDSSGRGWFALSPDDQEWTSTPAPAGASKTPFSVPARPAITASAASPCGSQPAFGVLPTSDGGTGQIFDMQGRPFLAKGVGVMEGQEPSAATLQSHIPGINFVRYAIYDYASPQALSAYVTSLTSAGIVVELEDHNNNAGNAGGSAGTIFTGQTLATELDWYSAIGAYFKSNSSVWFGTNNEPSEVNANGQTDPSALSAWQQQTYQAVRGAGNDNPILLELNGWADPASFGQGYSAADYTAMYNIIWDLHFYGWLTNFNTDVGANESFLQAAVKQAEQFTSSGGMKIPVIIGEYGNSTTGLSIDPNGTQVVQAVQRAALSGTILGTAAWAYSAGNPGDGLLTQGGVLSSYGQQVANYVAQAAAAAPASLPAAGCPTTGVTPTPPAKTAVTLNQPRVSDAVPSAPVANPAVAASNAAAQADINRADAIIAHATAALQGSTGRGPAQ